MEEEQKLLRETLEELTERIRKSSSDLPSEKGANVNRDAQRSDEAEVVVHAAEQDEAGDAPVDADEHRRDHRGSEADLPIKVQPVDPPAPPRSPSPNCVRSKQPSLDDNEIDLVAPPHQMERKGSGLIEAAAADSVPVRDVMR